MSGKRSTPSPPTMPTRPPASSMHQDRKLMMVSIIGPTPFSLAGRGQVALVRQLEDGDDRNEIDQRIDQGHVQQVAVAGDKDNQGYGQHGFGAKHVDGHYAVINGWSHDGADKGQRHGGEYGQRGDQQNGAHDGSLLLPAPSSQLTMAAISPFFTPSADSSSTA